MAPAGGVHQASQAILHEPLVEDEYEPDSPYNWPASRKIMTGIICSSSQLITTMSASMLVPALDQILADLDVDPFRGQVAFSIFFLGLGIAPFVVAPLSEVYGRRPIWLAGNCFYIVWNSLCPVGHSLPLMVIGRFLSACGACVGVTLTGPIMADVYGAKDRGKAVAIAGILPYIGPALGPIIGGLAAEYLWWPWLFWILSICNAGCLVLGYFTIRETYGPVLKQRVTPISTGNAASGKWSRASLIHHCHHQLQETLSILPTVKKPIKLLVFRPIIQILAASLSVSFGTFTLVLGSFASLWRTSRQQSSTEASLHYITIMLGAVLSSQTGGLLMNFIWRKMKARYPSQKPAPEYRIPYMLIGILPATAGLLLYAWAAQRQWHWVSVDLGVMLFTFGSFMTNGAINAYLFDEFPQSLSASAGAAVRLGSYLAGFAFPLFSPALFDVLGYGWGNSLLALLFMGCCGLTGCVLWVWGQQIRSHGRSKTGQEDDSASTN